MSCVQTLSEIARAVIVFGLTGDKDTQLKLLTHFSTGSYTAVSADVLDDVIRLFPGEVTNDVLAGVCPPHTRSLRLSGCSSVSLKGVLSVLNKCPNLKSVDLTGCEHLMQTPFFSVLSRYAPQLVTLTLDECDRLSSLHVQKVLQLLPCLQNLSVAQSSITDDAFDLEDTDHRCQLTHVNVSGCQKLTLMAIVNLTGMTGPTLQHINMSFTAVDTAALWYLCGFTLQSAMQLLKWLTDRSGDLPGSTFNNHRGSGFVKTTKSQSEEVRDLFNLETAKVLVHTLIKAGITTESKDGGCKDQREENLPLGGDLEHDNVDYVGEIVHTGKRNDILKSVHTCLICPVSEASDNVEDIGEDGSCDTLNLSAESYCGSSVHSMEQVNHRIVDIMYCTPDREGQLCDQLVLLNTDCVQKRMQGTGWASGNDEGLRGRFKSDMAHIVTSGRFKCDRAEIEGTSERCTSGESQDYVGEGTGDRGTLQGGINSIKSSCIGEDTSHRGTNGEGQDYIQNGCVGEGTSRGTSERNTDSIKVSCDRQSICEKGIDNIQPNICTNQGTCKGGTDNIKLSCVGEGPSQGTFTRTKVSCDRQSIGQKGTDNIKLCFCTNQGTCKGGTDSIKLVSVREGTSNSSASMGNTDNIKAGCDQCGVCNSITNSGNNTAKPTTQSMSQNTHGKLVECLCNKKDLEDKVRVSKSMCFSLTKAFDPVLNSLEVCSPLVNDIKVFNTCLKSLFLVNSGIQRFEVSCRQLCDEVVVYIADHAPKLRHLGLMECEMLTSTGVHAVCNKCPLSHLNLQGVCFIQNWALFPLWSHDQLTSLTLAECNITEVTLQKIAEHASQLTHLDLSWCEEITVEEHLPTFLKFIRSGASLQELLLRHLPLCDPILFSLAESCVNLRQLNLSSVTYLKDSLLLAISIRCRGLERLDVSWNSDLTDVSYRGVLCHLVQLRHLCMNGVKQITSSPLMPIIADLSRWRRCQALLRLKLQERHLLEESGASQASSDEEFEDLYVPHRSTSFVPKLRYLSLEYSDQQTDSYLAEVVAVCRGTLTIIDYYGSKVEPCYISSRAGCVFKSLQYVVG